jgi:chromosomal replication initiation ATPase DnaA
VSTIELTEADIVRNAVLRVQHQPFDPRRLAEAIAARWGLTRGAMLAPTPKGSAPQGNALEARRELYAELRSRGWSYPEIGRFCGRDHTTVLYALRQASPCQS